MKLVKNFVSDLEATYGVGVQEVSLADEWSKNRPERAESSSVQTYLENVSRPDR